MPTRFSSYTDDQLVMVFSTPIWESKSMSPEAKVEALQEQENRLAKADGIAPRTVMIENMEGCRSGYQRGSVIMMNKSLVESGIFQAEVEDGNGGKTTQIIGAPAPSWQCLDTLAHEHAHGRMLDEGTNQTAASYVKPETDYDIYRISPDERAAFGAGQKAALDALNRVSELTGTQDINHQDYVDHLAQNSFVASLEAAKQHFGDPNILQAVDTVVRDREAGRMVAYQSRGENAVARLIDIQNAKATSQATSQGAIQGNAQGTGTATHAATLGAGNLGDKGEEKGMDDDHNQDLVGWESDLAEAEGAEQGGFEAGNGYDVEQDDGYDNDDGMEM